VHWPYLVAPPHSIANASDGHAFWPQHALLFRVELKESIRCLCRIALVPAEVGVSWIVSSPQPGLHPPQAGYLRSEVVFSLLFSSSFPSHERAASPNLHMWLERRCHSIPSFSTVMAALPSVPSLF